MLIGTPFNGKGGGVLILNFKEKLHVYKLVPLSYNRSFVSS